MHSEELLDVLHADHAAPRRAPGDRAVSCETMTSLGAYVLCALDERERDRIDEHVAGCARCRNELEALMPLGSYLARATPEEVVGRSPVALHARLRAAVRAERRRVVRGRLAAFAAVAAALALAVVAWPADDRLPTAPPAPVRATAAADSRTGVRATVAAASRMWGTELRVRVTGADPGERCRLIARARDGRTDVAATWWTTYGGTEQVTGAAAIPIADVVALDVVTTAGRRLVHIPMDR